MRLWLETRQASFRAKKKPVGRPENEFIHFRSATTRKNEVVVSVTNAANKKDNMKIDYVNLTTQKQYFQPQYNSTTKQAERQKTTYNKFSQLTYVNYTNVR